MQTVDRNGYTKFSVEAFTERYGAGVKKLMPYVDWLSKNAGAETSRDYNSQMESTMSFPVYDGTLLSFVKEAQATGFMNRNYQYLYLRADLNTAEDELKFIERARLEDMDTLAAILSKYVMGGMTKGSMWTDAVRSGVFCKTVQKMNDLLASWNHEVKAIR